MRKIMRLENNIDQICDELTLKIETLRQVLKKKPQGSFTFSSKNVETGGDKERESLKKIVKEVREKLIKALKE
jgi:hypothetical protein